MLALPRLGQDQADKQPPRSSRKVAVNTCLCVLGVVVMLVFTIRPDTVLYPACIAAQFYILVVLLS